MKSAALHNLGCKVNSYELDIMRQSLQEHGYKIVPFDEIADVYIVNTCTVTNVADRKSRQMLHRAKQKNPKAVVVAAGCYVQTDPEGIQADPLVDLAVGNNRKRNIAEILEEYFRQREKLEGSSPEFQDKTLGGSAVIEIGGTREYEEATLTRTAEHTRAYIKIQDGCNQFCSYCAIPLARGRVRSRRAEDVLREVEGIAEAGYKEIVLTGIHISSYGIDLEEDAWEQGTSLSGKDYRGRSKLLDLVEKLHTAEGISRIRLGSLEPRIVTQEAAERLAALPKVCPHFHLSLQSGCDETLRRMNRHYTAEQYLRSVEALRLAYAPEKPAITTDVIVGFPGETEKEFETSKSFLEKVNFYEMHVFPYSRRAGTRAAEMPDQVPGPVKSRRLEELLDLTKRQSQAFRGELLGREAQVLLEEEKTIGGKRYLIGHTGTYVKAAVEEGGHRPNDLVTLRLREFLTEEILLGCEPAPVPDRGIVT